MLQDDVWSGAPVANSRTNAVNTPYGSAVDTSMLEDANQGSDEMTDPERKKLMTATTQPPPPAPLGQFAGAAGASPPVDPLAFKPDVSLRPFSPSSPTPTPIQPPGGGLSTQPVGTPTPAPAPLGNYTSEAAPSGPDMTQIPDLPGNLAPVGTPTTPKTWSLNDPRAQADILQQDFGGDYNAFMRASPNASVAAMANTPGFDQLSSGNGLGADGYLYGANGQRVSPAGSAPNTALLDSINAVQRQAGATPVRAADTSQPTETRYLQGGLTYDKDATPLSSADPNAYNALADLIRQQRTAGTQTDGALSAHMQDLLKQNPDLATALPDDQLGAYKSILSLSGYDPSNGGAYTPPSASTPGASPSANPAAGVSPLTAGGAGSTANSSASASGAAPANMSALLSSLGGGVGSALAPSTPTPPQTPTGSTGQLPTSAASASNYANITPTNPDNDLRSQTITPGAGLDRFQLAQDQLKTFNDKTAPYYEAALRSANQQAAASGRLGSGMLRTSLGDLANQRNLQLSTQGQEFLQNALEGSQSDAQTKLSDLLAEQQFQQGQQQTAFNQNVVGQQLQDSLTNSAFGRALQMLNSGNASDPSNMQLTLSGLYGNQANTAMNSLAQLIGNTTSANRSNASNQQLLQFLQSLGITGGGASKVTPAPGNSFPDN